MSISILVVDDEPDLEILLVQKFRRSIRDGALRFLFARDGVEALTILADHEEVDVVLSDINMPRMDGLSLLARLRERGETLSTIIVSAYSDMANIRTAMNRGAYDFVTKPIDFCDLEATIDKTIRHVENMREVQRRQALAEQARASLSRYFSPNLADRLASSANALDLGGARREVVSLFTDLTGFTSLVEAIEPNVLGPLLNDYIVGMTDIVFAHWDRSKDNRRCTPRSFWSSGGSTRPCGPRHRLFAGTRRLRVLLPRTLEQEGNTARPYPNRRACRKRRRR
ncbi:UNVERIFIED_ORG: CheY-like chemotaxis protein [Rhizobium etli]